jgi:hypothetical protein
MSIDGLSHSCVALMNPTAQATGMHASLNIGGLIAAEYAPAGSSVRKTMNKVVIKLTSHMQRKVSP